MTNLIKSTALAAAMALGATSAIAAGGFGFQTMVDDQGAITLDMIRAENDGVVVIYDYTNGEFGDVLGMTEVNAGANDDVKIVLENNIADDVAAVLYAGDMSTPDMADAWIELEVSEED